MTWLQLIICVFTDVDVTWNTVVKIPHCNLRPWLRFQISVHLSAGTSLHFVSFFNSSINVSLQERRVRLRQCTAQPSRAATEGDAAKLHAVFFWSWCKRKMKRRRKAFVNWEYFFQPASQRGEMDLAEKSQKVWSGRSITFRRSAVTREKFILPPESSELTAYARFTLVRCRC